MWFNYLKTAWRNLLRQKGYALLNILGLALGMAVALLIFSYVRVDLRWDRWQEYADRIVRPVELQDFGGDEKTDVAVTMAPLGPMLVSDLPEVEMAVRVMGAHETPVLARNETRLYAKNTAYVDSTYFQMFSFELLRGDAASVLTRKDAVVLTETARDRYFARSEDPIGQVLRVNNERDVIVTGIAADPPEATHLSADVYFPFDAIPDDQSASVDDWGTNNLATYLLLAEGVDRTGLDKKITDAYQVQGDWANLSFWVQPLTDMHLHSEHIEIDINPGKTSMNSVYALTSIGVFILLLACINFMNLATARAMTRAREVSLRKVAGARQRELVAQFLGESMLVALFSMLLAALFVELAGGAFSDLAGRQLTIDVFSGGFSTQLLLALGLIVGLAAGFYPAIVLSGFRPVAVLKSQDNRSTHGGGTLRRALVVVQFSISIGLIIATGVVHAQIRYGLSKPLGFNKEQVLVIPVTDRSFWDNLDDHLNAFTTVPGVVQTAASARLPGRGGSSSGFRPEDSDRRRVINWNSISATAQEVFGWEVANGRFFDPALATDHVTDEDSTGTMLLNEAAARQFGWDDPVGKVVYGWGDMPFTVVGVVKDYHFSSLHQAIEPMLMVSFTEGYNYVSIRFDRPDAARFVDQMEAVWQERFPHRPFNYFFLDESFDKMFRTEQQQAGLFRAFSVVAVLIALLGILGLAAFATGRRTREIAVRKVLGASEGRVLGLLTREFALLVLLANGIAWPVAWWVMDRWFDQFAYRAPWPWWVFPAAGAATLAVAVATVALQAWRAVRVRPGLALRHE